MGSEVDLIFEHFPELSVEQKMHFTKMHEVYDHWNQRINLISRNDFQHFYERHVLHSLAIAKYIQFKPGTTVMDVGTGGGFPGIPLAVMFPDTYFTLVDSIGKKIKVVEAVAETLDLKNVTAINDRVENVDQQFHFIVSRAVTDFTSFYKWVQRKVSNENFNDKRNGIFYLKGGDLTEELKLFIKKAEIYDLHQQFNLPFFETKKLVYLGDMRILV